MSSKDCFFIESKMTYFNSSYGVVPKDIHEYHKALLIECEKNPYNWFTKIYKNKLIEVKNELSKYINCLGEDLVIVDNSSSAANSIFNSLVLDENSVIIMLDTAYGVIRNLIHKSQKQSNCRVIEIPVQICNLNILAYNIETNIAKAHNDGYDVKLVCIDYIASCPAIVFPVCDIANVCKQHKIPVFVDGAHTLGQLALNMKELEENGVSYWISDTHKWFFSPKGSAVMWVSKDKQNNVNPTIDCATIGSKGCLLTANDYYVTEFENRFMYLGTKDYTPWLSIKGSIDFIEKQGGYDTIIKRNRDLALWSQKHLCNELNTYCISDNVTASMCNIRLLFIKTNTQAKKLKSHLESNNIYTIIYEFPPKIFWLRLCIQLFIDISDILHLSYILKEYKNNLNIIHLSI